MIKMRRIIERIRRRKVGPEIKKMWEEVMIPLEKVIEERDKVFRQFALTNNCDYRRYADLFDCNGLTSLRLEMYAEGGGVTYRYTHPYFRPTTLSSKFYEELKKDPRLHEAFDELSKGGLFEVFYSFLTHSKFKDRVSSLESIMRKSLGYLVGCYPHLKKDSDHSWKILIKEILRIGYGLNKKPFYYDLEIHESYPVFPLWGGIIYKTTSGHEEKIPETIDEFLRRDPDEDSECFQNNLRTLKQVSDHYHRLVSDKEVQKTFRAYDENPMETLKKVRNLVEEEFPDNTEIASYLIEDTTKRTSRKIMESAQRIFQDTS